MAVVSVNKPSFELTSQNRIRWTVQWACDTLAEAKTGFPRSYDGALFLSASGSPFISEDGKWITVARYEDLTEEGNEALDDYNTRGELREINIEEFPDRELLEKEFGAYEDNGELKFPPNLPETATSPTGLPALSSTGQPKDEENPLFNTKTWPVEYETAIWRMVRKKKPAKVMKLAGTVVRKLPSGFEYTGDDESWYVRPIETRKSRGGLWSITVTFQEIDDFKAQKALLALLGKSKRNGLTTGGLTTGGLG